MMDETALLASDEAKDLHEDEGVDMPSHDIAPATDDEKVLSDVTHLAEGGVVRTLDGEIAGDEFAQDALNYQILLGKIDTLLDELKLDA